jgi:hypothetical protein
MKKASIICILLLLSFFLTAGTVEYTYYFNSPTVSQAGTFQTITFSQTFLTGKTGEPALPYQAVRLLLPPGEEAISVNYRFEDEKILEGLYTIFPQQPSHPLSLGSDGVFHQKREIYSSQDTYPSQAWGEYSTHFLNGYSFLLTTFTPVNYLPAPGTVSFFGKITVTIETRSTERAALAMANLNTSAKILSRLHSLAQNAAMISAYPAKSTREGEYQILIITPQQFAANFQQLEELYFIRGFKTEIVSVESISQQSAGQDLQEKIRNYIIAEYQAHGIEHVLLGGDVEHIPYRGFYCSVQSSSIYTDNNIPADLYYSALDGNWNTNGDSYWGEIGEDDLLPDVSVARFPVSSASQLQRMLNKTIRYQDAPVLGEFRKVLLAGEELWTNPDTYGEDYLELLIGYHEDNGYVTDGIPDDYTFTKLYDHLANWSKNTLINAINQGQSFVHHSGHANQTYVMRLGIGDINNINFSQANGTDHNYTLIYTHGCLCGAFDENDCIGEAMVLIDNLAVAGAFNSRYGWFNEGQTEGPSAHLHREFVDALYHDREWQIGAAHRVSKIETSVWVNAPGQWEEGALRWCFYDCNIFGDPALGVWTEEPISIVSDYPGEIYPETTTVPVTVTSNGEPLVGMNCIIISNGEMLGSSTTDESGQAIVNVPGGFSAITAAELVVSGWNCLPNHYELNLMVGIEEFGKENINLSILPNPFTDQVRLVFQLEEAKPVFIRFYQVSGQELEEIRLEGKKGFNELSLNTSKWPEGVIMARVITDSRVIHTRMMHIR